MKAHSLLFTPQGFLQNFYLATPILSIQDDGTHFCADMEFEHVTQLQPDMNLQAFKDQIGNIE
jgi:hypothetical protein